MCALYCDLVKPYVLLIAIRLSDGHVKPDRPLGSMENSRLLPAPDFPFIFLTHAYKQIILKAFWVIMQ